MQPSQSTLPFPTSHGSLILSLMLFSPSQKNSFKLKKKNKKLTFLFLHVSEGSEEQKKFLCF